MIANYATALVPELWFNWPKLYVIFAILGAAASFYELD